MQSYTCTISQCELFKSVDKYLIQYLIQPYDNV